MNAKKLMTVVAAALCATGAFAADNAQVDFSNTFAPYEVTAQNNGNSGGADTTAKNAGAGDQATPAVNFANTMEPWVVTAQSPAQPQRATR